MDRRRPLVGLAVIAVAAVAAIALGGGGGNASDKQPLFGFNESAGPTSYRLQAELGAPVRRMVVGWNQVEPAPGIWQWGMTDAAYRAQLRVGLRPLLLAIAAPCWAHPSSPCTGSGTGGIPPDPAYDRDWAEFVQRLTKRYPKAVAIEIWNEENIQPEFLPYPNPERYTELLKEAYRAVRQISHRLPVISGGLFVSAASGPYGIGDAQFLAGMYAAGARGFVDGIGIHVYPLSVSPYAGPANEVAALDQVLTPVRAVMRSAHASAPLWITELGIPTQSGPGSPAAATETQQAADLVAIIRHLKHEADVAAVLIDRLIDPSPVVALAPGNLSGFGVFRADGSPKPAACAVSTIFHGHLVC